MSTTGRTFSPKGGDRTSVTRHHTVAWAPSSPRILDRGVFARTAGAGEDASDDEGSDEADESGDSDEAGGADEKEPATA